VSELVFGGDSSAGVIDLLCNLGKSVVATIPSVNGHCIGIGEIIDMGVEG